MLAYSIMKPIQVYLDEGDMRRLEAWAEQHEMTKSDAWSRTWRTRVWVSSAT